MKNEQMDLNRKQDNKKGNDRLNELNKNAEVKNSLRLRRRDFFGLIGSGILFNSVYELISLSRCKPQPTISYNYPNEKKIFKGRIKVGFSKDIFSPDNVQKNIFKIGPFEIGRTQLKDLNNFWIDPKYFNISLYTYHPGPGNNAIRIMPKNNQENWYAIYLSFGPKSKQEFSHLSSLGPQVKKRTSNPGYSESDILLYADIVLGKEANKYSLYPFGGLHYIGQRPFDGALIYQSQQYNQIYFTQMTGEVAPWQVPEFINQALRDPSNILLERYLIGYSHWINLGWLDMDWVLGGFGFGFDQFWDQTAGCCWVECTGSCTAGCCTTGCTSGGCQKCTNCTLTKFSFLSHDYLGTCNWTYTLNDFLNMKGLWINQIPEPFENFNRFFIFEERMKTLNPFERENQCIQI